MAQATCSVDGCGRRVLARGYCSTHYGRWRRGWTPDQIAQRHTRNGEPMEFFENAMMLATDECIVWPYGKAGVGYGVLNARQSGQRYVHVLACERAHGPRPEGYDASHGPCNNPACFNPRHLSWEPHRQNMNNKHRDGTMAHVKLTADQVREIRRRHAAGEAASALAADVGLSAGHVYRIVSRHAWAAVA